MKSSKEIQEAANILETCGIDKLVENLEEKELDKQQISAVMGAYLIVLFLEDAESREDPDEIAEHAIGLANIFYDTLSDYLKEHNPKAYKIFIKILDNPSKK